MRTFKIKDGDLVFDGQNNLTMVDERNEEVQSVERLLTTNTGEWFLNIEHGLDYSKIQGKNVSDEQIRLAIMQALAQEDRIEEVENVDIIRNDKYRTATISVRCRMKSGRAIEVSFPAEPPILESDFEREYWFILPYQVIERSFIWRDNYAF